MSVGNIQTTQHGNAVAFNAARAAGAEGGGSIEAQVMSLMSMGYETNVKIMKNQVQAYRSQLKLQQTYNDALAKMEKYAADFSKPGETNNIRSNGKDISSGSLDKVQQAINAGASSYTEAVTNAKGLTDNERKDFMARAEVADMASALGMEAGGKANNDLNAFVKGDYTKGFHDAMKTKIKGAMDAIGADLQLAMIDIQTVKGRMDQYMTAMTQFTKSTADKGESIARNL